MTVLKIILQGEIWTENYNQTQFYFIVINKDEVFKKTLQHNFVHINNIALNVNSLLLLYILFEQHVCVRLIM